MTHWRKWAAEHEYEDLKEGFSSDPIDALLRKKINEEWTHKHRDVLRKIVVEGGWVQKRMYDIIWSDEKKCQGVVQKKAQRSTDCATAGTSKVDWKWQRGITTHPLSESQWTKSHLIVRKWESEKHNSWCIPARGFRDHVATDGSLLGVAGKWCACGWSEVQLDDDEELGPMHGMYGTLEAALEVQRTIKRADFLCLLRRAIRPTMVHVDKKVPLMGCGWEKRIASVRTQKTLICGMQFGRN